MYWREYVPFSEIIRFSLVRLGNVRLSFYPSNAVADLDLPLVEGGGGGTNPVKDTQIPDVVAFEKNHVQKFS